MSTPHGFSHWVGPGGVVRELSYHPDHSGPDPPSSTRVRPSYDAAWASSAETLGELEPRLRTPIAREAVRPWLSCAAGFRPHAGACLFAPQAVCGVSVVFRPTQTSDPPRETAAGMQGVARATAPDPDYKRSQCAPDCFAPQAVALMPAPAFLRRRLWGVRCVSPDTDVRPSSRRGCWYAGCGSSHGPAPRFQEKCPCAPDC